MCKISCTAPDVAALGTNWPSKAAVRLMQCNTQVEAAGHIPFTAPEDDAGSR